MTRYQINQLNMLEGIALFLQTYAERLSGNPKVAALAAILAVIIQNIRDAKQIQDKTTEAESKIKMDLQEKILQELHNIGIALRAYAGGGVDPVVYAVGNYKDWEIEHLRNSDLADKAREVFETAKPIIEKLSSAVTEDIASLDVNYKAYMKARPDIGVTEAKSETATATIDSKILRKACAWF